MRDLVFKNMTSNNKGRKVISTLETMEANGVLTRIRRNFVYIIKNCDYVQKHHPLPRLYVLKLKNSDKNEEKFLCRVKGGLYTVNNNKLFFVLFSHSLNINLSHLSG